ncbi:MAG: 2,3-bisphosphoglycerate-independent phosphoglycerate mutase [Oscillospiraceae bacterium]|jgi:2,3-bisphosphoglycerate-independent phosphoglycerate mutase|nr:2,3-bisphosphoglycerate-independent phosphoglycerate mutase [Oscillospiraceae bacterium]
MRYILLIPDGSADKPIAELGNKTPYMALDLPGFVRLAGGLMGQARTVPMGVAPGSDTAILTIFGNDVKREYKGRAALEAAGAGIELREGEVALRMNLCSLTPDPANPDALEYAVMKSHNGCGIEGEEALELTRALLEDETFSTLASQAGFTIHQSPTFRQMGVLDHADDEPFILGEPHMILGQPIAGYLPKGNRADELARLMSTSYDTLRKHPLNIKRGDRAANCIWPWAAGRAMALPNFGAKYGHSGLVITAVPLMKGIALLSGLSAPDIPGASGDIDTDYEAKVDALIAGLKAGADFGCVHVEAPDECAHAKDVEAKLESLRRFDARIVLPLLERLPDVDTDFRILVLSDHLTLLSNGAHDGDPVPFALYDSRKPGAPRPFNEETTRYGLYVADGMTLMDLLFGAIA